MKCPPRLSAEQNGLRELFSHYDESLSVTSRKGFAMEIGRIADAIHRTRSDLIFPALKAMGIVSQSLEDAVVGSDLGQVILCELHPSQAADRRQDALVRALQRTLLAEWDLEERPGGLWGDPGAVTSDCDALDAAVALRLRQLLETSPTDDWRPCPPDGIFMGRNSWTPNSKAGTG